MVLSEMHSHSIFEDSWFENGSAAEEHLMMRREPNLEIGKIFFSIRQ